MRAQQHGWRPLTFMAPVAEEGAIPHGEGMLNPRSRMHPQPRGRRIAITERDRAMFGVLSRYRFLPSNFIHAFVGGHPVYHRDRLTDLFHERWLAKPEAQWEMVDARYRYNTYALGVRARTYLAEQGVMEGRSLGTAGAFRHELMVCELMASFELSATHFGVSFLSWKDVLAHAPPSTQAARAPFAIPLGTRDADRGSRTLRADGFPFGLQARRTCWFVGFEADRHTEPLHPAEVHTRQSSILQKVQQYRQFIQERTFQSHFGMPNVLVPIVTVNDRHLHNIMALVHELTSGAGFRWMLFLSLPDLAGRTGSVLPRVDLLSVPWLRCGHPPLTLLEAIGA